jgi:hypothetical protein
VGSKCLRIVPLEKRDPERKSHSPRLYLFPYFYHCFGDLLQIYQLVELSQSVMAYQFDGDFGQLLIRLVKK